MFFLNTTEQRITDHILQNVFMLKCACRKVLKLSAIPQIMTVGEVIVTMIFLLILGFQNKIMIMAVSDKFFFSVVMETPRGANNFWMAFMEVWCRLAVYWACVTVHMLDFFGCKIIWIWLSDWKNLATGSCAFKVVVIFQCFVEG